MAILVRREAEFMSTTEEVVDPQADLNGRRIEDGA